MIIINYLFTGVTAWSLAYIMVSSRKREHEKWYGACFYLLLFLNMVVLDFDWIYSLVGLVIYIITTYFTSIPKFENGHFKIV